MRCRKCLVWEINGRDLYCSWCGRKVFEFGLRKTPVRLYLAERKAQPRSAHIIENQSPIPVSIECVDPPPWLKINPVRSEVPPGGQFRVSLDVDFQKLGGFNYKAEPVVFRPAAAAGGHEDFESLAVKVETWPRPQVVCKELTFFTSEPPLRARLRVETDYPLTVTGIRFNLPYLMPEGEFPVELGESGEAEIPVQLNLPPQAEFKKELVTYHLDVEGLPTPLTGQFDLIIRRSAVLHCPELGEANITLMSGAEDEVALAVYNMGEEVLRVEDLKIEPLRPAPGVEVRAEPRVFSVEPGKQTVVKLRASARAEAQSASHYFRITFQSNDPVTEHAEGNLNVEVSNEAYAGFVALDFGTTDSAVAVFKTDSDEAENLSLEKGIRDPKIYSNILFVKYCGDKAEPPYDWEIGREAKGFGSTKQKFHLFFKAVKTKVGKNHAETLKFKDLGVERKVKAEEIVKFILMDLLRRTRQALGQSPARFILSVPTRFTLRQKKLLKEAFGAAARAVQLNVEKVKTIDESLAAGLFYIVNRGQQDELIRGKVSYNMMLLDFGGGTTDVTVFNVRRPAGARLTDTRGLEVETLGAWGDAELGGEKITALIAELLAEKFLGRKSDNDDKDDASIVKQLEDKAEAAKLIFSELVGLPQRDGRLDIAAVPEHAHKRLRESLRVLEFGYDTIEQFLKDYSTNGRQLRVEARRFGYGPVVLDEDEVVKIYEHKLLKIKKDLLRLLEEIGRRRAAGGEGDDDTPPKLDLLLLAGQSSQFPTVSQLLSDLAENMDFIRDSDSRQLLKECVSRGALYYSASGGLGLTITGEKRMWNRLGTIEMDLTGRRFVERIPWGQDYPWETPPFPLYDKVSGHTLRIELKENLSLDNGKERKTVKYKDFARPLDSAPQEVYLCKLQVDGEGDVKAFCEINGGWLEIEEQL
jgi:hypothetical protein